MRVRVSEEPKMPLLLELENRFCSVLQRFRAYGAAGRKLYCLPCQLYLTSQINCSQWFDFIKQTARKDFDHAGRFGGDSNCQHLAV
jgi:hypothetical protein